MTAENNKAGGKLFFDFFCKLKIKTVIPDTARKTDNMRIIEFFDNTVGLFSAVYEAA